MEIKLELVKEEEKEILFRLLQYSLFEENVKEMNEEGMFDYPWFDAYFTEKDRYAFFIKEKESDSLAGFVMVNSHLQKFSEGHSIAEFMVIPGYRKKKVGKQAAYACFDRFKGNWEVSPAKESSQAYYFWKHVIGEYTNDSYQWEDGIFLFHC